VLHVGAIDREKLGALIGPSRFDSEFENPVTNRIDYLIRDDLDVAWHRSELGLWSARRLGPSSLVPTEHPQRTERVPATRFTDGFAERGCERLAV
jgi:hypothetical protein